VSVHTVVTDARSEISRIQEWSKHRATMPKKAFVRTNPLKNIDFKNKNQPKKTPLAGRK
jgi:hypothetical protein